MPSPSYQEGGLGPQASPETQKQLLLPGQPTPSPPGLCSLILWPENTVPQRLLEFQTQMTSLVF